MFDPLIKLLLTKLDALVDAYLERQQFINLIALPGTLLFLFLFWAFSGAGVATLLVGLFLVPVEAALAGGLYLLNEKYRTHIRESGDVADAIEAYLSGADVFGEWSQFLQTPLADPELEAVRYQCAILPQQYPPTEQGEYCGPGAIPVLESLAEALRFGIVTKFYRELSIRRASKRFAAEGGFEQQTTHGVKHMRSLAPSSFMDDSTLHRVEQEATREAKQAYHESKKEAKRAAKAAKKANKRAAAAERKRRKKGLEDYELPDDQVYDEHGFIVDSSGPPTVPMAQPGHHEGPLQPPATPMQPAAPMQPPATPMQPAAPMQPPATPMQPAAPMQPPPMPMQQGPGPLQPPAPAPAPQQPVMQAPAAPPAFQMAPPQPPAAMPVPPPPPAPPRARKRQKGGLSEAGAIQQVMRAGYTAHHYDQAQQTLARRLGRNPKPAEVVKALLDNNWGKGPKKRKRRKSRKAKVRAASVRVTRSMGTMGEPDLDGPGPHQLGGRRRRRGRGALRVMTVMALVAASPFAAWRLKRPETSPLVVTGQVYHQVLDKAPDLQHRIRTPFEELFGNRPVNLVDGRRIYVSEADYKLCWPEPWEVIYDKGYSIVIDAEVEQLLFGGFGVARITSAERVNGPIANAH